MPAYSYPYVPHSTLADNSASSKEATLRPVLVVTLTTPDGTATEVPALVDSGADFCVFPLSVAASLRLNFSDMEQTLSSGVGSHSNVTHHIRLAVDAGNGLTFIARCGFTRAMNHLSFGLLGQNGFFENHTVTFRRSEKLFLLEPSPTELDHAWRP